MRRRIVLALTCLLASASFGCRAVSRLSPFAEHPDVPPAIAPALSVAGTSSLVCVDTRPRHLLVVSSGSGGRTSLEVGARDRVATDAQLGIGGAIVRQFACTRYTVEIAVPLKSGEKSSLSPLRTRTELLETGFLASDDRVTLWTIADLLRLDAREPFVYGVEMDLSETDSVQLRFDAASPDARLLLVYRLGL